MKILHTSDWHVGRTIKGRSREDEHIAVLAEIAGTVREEGVDLVLVAGDVFDTATPSATAEEIVYRALMDITRAGAEVVVVAGNHDNWRRFRAVRPLLRLAGVHAAPQFALPDSGGCIRVTGRNGETACVGLFPWLSQRNIVNTAMLMADRQDEHQASYAATCLDGLSRLSAAFTAETVNIIVAHLTTANATPGGGERDAEIRGGPGTIFDYWVPQEQLPKTASYVALGHIHRQQQVSAQPNAWYSGSPLQLDFGEASEGQGVLLIEARPGVPVKVTPRRLSAGKKLVTIRGDLAELGRIKDARAELADAHLRVFVSESPRTGLADELRDLFPSAVEIRVDAPVGESTTGARPVGLTARALLELYLDERKQRDEAVLSLFDELSLELLHAS